MRIQLASKSVYTLISMSQRSWAFLAFIKKPLFATQKLLTAPAVVSSLKSPGVAALHRKG
jgi:hypothetical protein